MSFPKYQKFKEGGVEWLEVVPEHWSVWKLAHAFTTIGSGTTPKTDSREYYDDGDIPWVNTGDLNDGELDDCEKRVTTAAMAEYSTLKLYPAGSLLIAMYGATTGKLGLLRFPATVNQACCVLSGATAIVPRFLFYWLLGFRERILGLATGGGQPNISQDIVRALRVARPDVAEQSQIVEFLDHETVKIDGLIAEQRRLVELLKQKRQALISDAVTKGLNPNAPMKPSGIEWLGDVPEHWGVSASRRMFAVRSEPALETDEMLTASQKYGVLFQSEFVEREGRRVVEVILGTQNLKHVEPNDFIISMRSFQGGLEWSQLRGSTSFHYVMVKPVKWVHPPFFAHLFKSATYIQALRATADLIRDGQELRFSNFVQVCIPVVPMKEQAEIAAYLDAEIAKLDNLAEVVQRAIGLLQERRTALISAAVTGQIDVRQLAEKQVAA